MTLGHLLRHGIKRDRNRKFLCAFFFPLLAWTVLQNISLLFCILYTSVYQWNTTTWCILRMCSVKCCFTNTKMKMNHRLRATGSPNFLLSFSKLPKSLFSCVFFSKVPIVRSKCTYILWLVYVMFDISVRVVWQKRHAYDTCSDITIVFFFLLFFFFFFFFSN